MTLTLTRYALRAVVTFACLLVFGHAVSSSFGQFGGFGQQSVGGISVDANGVVQNVNIEARNNLRANLLAEMKKGAGEPNRPLQLRMISLKGLEAAIAEAHRNKSPLPNEVTFLAGLQRIEYVLVYPAVNDIVLAGPGEAWKVDANANIVGVTTGRPVIHIDDLLIALRTVQAARNGGISCSIDPTPEGRESLQRYLNSVKGFSPDVLPGMQESLGMQRVTLQGTPGDSHFARVLVAADYHMKRIAMHLDPSPLKALPSFLEMMKASNTKLTDMMPRWWMECNYEPLLRSEDGLTWQIRGQGVKTLTKSDLIGANGKIVKKGAGKNVTAQKWADKMTEQYGELSKANVVFGELRNIMDMCVIAALIEKEGLLAKAGLQLPLLTDPISRELPTTSWSVPKGIATQCSLLNTGREYIVTASGGVSIDSYKVASNFEMGKGFDETRAKGSSPEGKTWWW